jgi:hypothetical protein
VAILLSMYPFMCVHLSMYLFAMFVRTLMKLSMCLCPFICSVFHAVRVISKEIRSVRVRFVLRHGNVWGSERIDPRILD